MAIREEAQRNHDVLFPNHESTLKGPTPSWSSSSTTGRLAMCSKTRRWMRGRA